MKKINSSYYFKFLVLLFIFLIFFKTDYRFSEGIFCCGDDYDYFAHAQTIAEDFDLDYSNQLKGFENKRYNLEGKVAPKGFFGSGLLSSPFLFIGNMIDKFVFNLKPNEYITLMNYSLLIYSLSSVTFVFFTCNLLKKSLFKLKIDISIYEILLIYSSSGVIYFAFERFSMSHVYETFSIALIIFLSIRYYIDKKTANAFFIPLSILLAFLVRVVNYYVLLIPLIISFIVNKKFDFKIYKNPYFIYSTILSIIVYIYLSIEIYGLVTFNPQTMYGTSGLLGGFFGESNFLDFVYQNIINSFIILFGKEFGIFWFSPIIFFGLISSFFISKNQKKSSFVIFSIPYVISFGAVLLWKSTASSYGFRYLYSLVPISIVYFYYFANSLHFQKFRKALLLLSIFAIVSILFFETTELTQLSTTEELNSFGRTIKYVEPNYLTGYLLSLVNFDSYLKIFTTSFLGAISFKIFLSILGYDMFLDLLNRLKLPVNNQEFIDYLYEVQIITVDKFIFIFIYFLLLSYNILKSSYD